MSQFSAKPVGLPSNRWVRGLLIGGVLFGLILSPVAMIAKELPPEQAPPPVGAPTLSLSIDDNTTMVAPDDHLTYSLTWTVEQEFAPNLNLDVVLPPTLTYEDHSPHGNNATYTEATRTVRWIYSSVPPGMTETVSVSISVPSEAVDGSALTVNASLKASNNGDFLYAVPASDTDIVERTELPGDNQPTLQLTKDDGKTTVAPGFKLDYTLNWSVGNHDAASLTLVDTLPPGTTLVEAPNGSYNSDNRTVTWTYGPTAVGVPHSERVTITVPPDAANNAVITNVASLKALENGSVIAEAQASDVTTVVREVGAPIGVPVENPLPVLGLEKSAEPAAIAAGNEVTYTLNYTVSDATAHDVTLVDPLPEHMAFVSASDGGKYDVMTNTIEWSLGEQAPGNYVVTLTTKAASVVTNGTVVTNTATVDAADAEPASDTANVTLGSRAVLTIEKTVDRSSVAAGETVLYTVRITNVGNDTAVGLRLSDALPDGFRITRSGDRSFTMTLGNLEAGRSVATTYETTVGKSVQAGNYDNVAKVVADNADQATDTARVAVTNPADLGVSDTAGEPTAGTTGQVLGAEDELPETGPGALDVGILLTAFSSLLGGSLLLRRRRLAA